MRYILFTKETCIYCERSIKYLESNDLVFNVVNFEEEQQAVLEQIKLAYDWSTVPMIFERDGNKINFVGGYTDLVEHLKDG